MCLVATPPAAADWLVVPHLGLKFSGDTNLIDLEDAAREKKTTIGVSGAWLGSGILGIEVDVAQIPGYFERAEAELVTSSNLVTVMGGVIVTTPLAVTRESLRPYVVGGAGMIRATSKDLLNLLPFESNLVGMQVGGGALGFTSDRFGVRFDLRYYRNLSNETAPGVDLGSTRLDFWRFTIGAVFRY